MADPKTEGEWDGEAVRITPPTSRCKTKPDGQSDSPKEIAAMAII